MFPRGKKNLLSKAPSKPLEIIQVIAADCSGFSINKERDPFFLFQLTLQNAAASQMVFATEPDKEFQPLDKYILPVDEQIKAS